MVKRDLIRNSILALIIAVIAILATAFYFSTYKVTALDSNRFVSEKDVLIYNKQQSPKIDDFVIYEVDGDLHMSRVIAEGGDQVTSMDDVLYVNNKIKPEPYLEPLKADYLTEVNHQTNFTVDFTLQMISKSLQKTIPEEDYLVLNDNRQNTKDSRQYGLIHQSQIKGVAMFNLFPLEKFGFLDTK
ncbi:MAG: signal peptidase I [Streptococcus hyovaginalis]|nr:signal peptidase I [Streptococcus hyovaginalis]